MHLFLQNPGRVMDLSVILSRACLGRRAAISCNPMRTASVSSASAGIFQGAEYMIWVAGRTPDLISL
jgi:hypothetical protein